MPEGSIMYNSGPSTLSYELKNTLKHNEDETD